MARLYRKRGAGESDDLPKSRPRLEDVPAMFDLYREPIFDESIRKAEYRTYTPFVKAFNCSDIVEFSINQVDSYFVMSDTCLSIKGKLVKTGVDDLTLAPNFAAFLFDSCSYSESSREFESVRDPGIVSSVRAMLCYSEEDSKFMSPASWNYPNRPLLNAADLSFHVLIPLKHIFNMFNDYRMITCGRQTIRLVRARNDNDCIISTTAQTTATVSIESIELRVKHVFPNDVIKEKLLKAIATDKPIMIPFRKWDLHELPTVTQGAKREVWAVKTSAAVERPRYAIVLFQTDKRNNTTADPTLFDNVNISSIRLSLNGEYYPNERMRLDFVKNDYADAHFNYSEFNPSYSNSTIKHCLLDFDSFKTHSLFVIDCSRHEETMKSTTVDVRLDIEASVGFPANTKAYCIVISDSLLEYKPLSEVVKSII